MKSRGNLSERKRIASLIVFLSIGTSGYSQNAAAPLKLTISADKASYSLGEQIKINYSIENISEEPVGFYEFGCDAMKTVISDLADKPYPYYYDKSMNRWVTSYPREYVFLKPHQKWQRNYGLSFKNGKIMACAWRKPDSCKVAYDGFYLNLNCPNSQECDQECDSILLFNLAGRKVQISAMYERKNSNLRKFTLQDCEKAKISVDVFPSDFKGNWINRSVLNEHKNFGLDDPSYDPWTFEELAIYCQHHTALSKEAWIGTLASNPIVINLNTRSRDGEKQETRE